MKVKPALQVTAGPEGGACDSGTGAR
ncbi:Protein of unknown function [Thermobacillus xylanilyticus]|uniref:Uncharacterized protein n=1 Tax=Thermobacillus xylanilyticus TaxID=76633 RepID=A0ABN7RS34_THEXY|nr:Protein of unknown function [Thermobacillus xylanilyticus]